MPIISAPPLLALLQQRPGDAALGVARRHQLVGRGMQRLHRQRTGEPGHAARAMHHGTLVQQPLADGLLPQRLAGSLLGTQPAAHDHAPVAPEREAPDPAFNRRHLHVPPVRQGSIAGEGAMQERNHAIFHLAARTHARRAGGEGDVLDDARRHGSLANTGS
jgi:hypothetical protein